VVTTVRRAVFLDRDGTVNREVSYLRRMEDLRLLPGVRSGIRLLNNRGIPVVVVTNQSGIARGYFEEAFVERVHCEIARRLARGDGARVDAWYYCPHHPTAGRGPYTRPCDCRKPAPGLILRACRELGVDAAASVVVGDSLRDLELAWNVGATAVLVETGYGREVMERLTRDQRNGVAHVARDLLRACEWICEYCW
jgi:D-glycero-D-manno-heptose 1,7-bisphosphate phosphatase